KRRSALFALSLSLRFQRARFRGHRQPMRRCLRSALLPELQVCIPGRGIAVIVGPEHGGIEQAGGEHDGCAYNHSVVAIPRILGSARPYHVDESQYTVTERSKVDRPRPDAQAKLPAGFPSLRTRD